MSDLWMLEDLEPWPDEPKSGAICAPTTFWASPDTMELPPEVCTTLKVQVEAQQVGGRTERIAHLGGGFSTVIGTGDGDIGEMTLTGCLVWDRYLWIDYRTQPEGDVRVRRRGHLVQRETLTPTKHDGWFSVSYTGPVEYQAVGEVERAYGIRWNALTVELGCAPGHLIV
ncbi:hypothetical protein [Gordonia sp. OPL2]|uniref:hypothetical protein n=1 Tax=Gordonia sp. OPL2 TaxID=2486274 RepID=UPI0016553DDD|nr:hypothetical protein [Gordonia sp. OPL2]RPA06146.1 hypothetical protein EEB19_09735 [Gordonia sp. OPL2]